jgi:serine/threonine protein kinase
MTSREPIDRGISPVLPGTKWVARGKLGEGGMGVVFDVVKAGFLEGAMKVLLPRFANVPELAARFLDEVKLTATLEHPNIVRVLDFDRLADGTPFMVMERLRGRTLRAALRQTAERGRRWTPDNSYAVAAHVCQGLARAHAHAPSIVHRDIKPENIFLHRLEGTVDPVIKVMDFGIAVVAGGADKSRSGTPRYMAPEQLRGDPVTPQTDQYALGLVIYEMLTGRLPWDVDLRDLAALTDAHLRIPPQPPSAFCAWLPAEVGAAILKALS